MYIWFCCLQRVLFVVPGYMDYLLYHKKNELLDIAAKVMDGDKTGGIDKGAKALVDGIKLKLR